MAVIISVLAVCFFVWLQGRNTKWAEKVRFDVLVLLLNGRSSKIELVSLSWLGWSNRSRKEGAWRLAICYQGIPGTTKTWNTVVVHGTKGRTDVATLSQLLPMIEEVFPDPKPRPMQPS